VRCGDWIAGYLSKVRQHRFLYAVEVDEILGLDDYYHDPRFASKKPNLRGSWKERCGDNFYSVGADGKWIQHRNRFHLNEKLKRQDTKFGRVFVGHKFWYLGKSAVQLPSRFAMLAGGRGVRVRHDPKVRGAFFTWVETSFARGVHDDPNENPDIND